MFNVDLEAGISVNRQSNTAVKSSDRRIVSARDAGTREATDKRQEFPVEGCAHLYLVVQPSGSKSWAWRARPKAGGSMVKATLGSFPPFSYAQAVGWAEERNRARDSGRDEREEQIAGERLKAIAARADAARRERSVSWYWSSLYAPRFVHPCANQREVVRWWNKHIEPAIGTKPISDIDHDDLSPIVSSIFATAPVTANRVATFLRTMFRRAVTDFRTETGLRTNPAEFITKPHRHEKRNRKQRVLDRRELGYLLLSLDRVEEGQGYQAVYARALKLAISTGVRISEAVEAPWSEFDLEAGNWTVAARKGNKNKLAHMIPLPPKLLEWLKAMKARTNSPFVFSVTGDAPLNGISKPQERIFAITRDLAARDDYAMERWSAHSLRRTFSTHLNSMRRGDDLSPLVHSDTIEALLNHQSGSSKAGVAGDYNKWTYAPEKKAALAVWERYLDTVLEETRVRDRARRAHEDAEAA